MMEELSELKIELEEEKDHARSLTEEIDKMKVLHATWSLVTGAGGG